MANAFQKAKKEKIYVKALLFGSSGSGKTYSALKLATGIYKKCGGTGIAVIDTEAGRSKYYANEFDFDILELSEPYTPEKFCEAIQNAIDADYKVVVIDSTTHEWLYLCQQAQVKPGAGTWAKLKPRHKVLMEKILFSPIHVISTGRGKDEYVFEEKEGKQVPKKVGVGVQQDKDAEYDYTVAFNIFQDSHVAEATKDNTHLFEGTMAMLTEKDGEKLYDWANSGEAVAPKPIPEVSEEPTTESVIGEISELFKQKMEQGKKKEELYDAVAEVNDGKKNFIAIKDIDTALAVLAALKQI